MPTVSFSPAVQSRRTMATKAAFIGIALTASHSLLFADGVGAEARPAPINSAAFKVSGTSMRFSKKDQRQSVSNDDILGYTVTEGSVEPEMDQSARNFVYRTVDDSTRAITARLDGLESTFNAKLDTMSERLASIDKNIGTQTSELRKSIESLQKWTNTKDDRRWQIWMMVVGGLLFGLIIAVVSGFAQAYFAKHL
ncbi:hypothetical protein [Alicyclobacillus sp. ALC3]|uniref:hypothetical protein n=1 Tax=Alicyclobacillus sp. ALC3 TaxID=2796143 RepID=UPI002377F915|nr:hypothetical protein [Alicyclobacillus sp. ALC3]WDL96370.1 hypothetical protein JC200_18900 [Alicyclobacillus sp. ALC3]